MDAKPDDRSDNVGKIQDNIDNTVRNIRLTNEIIKDTEDSKRKEELKDKNQRREEALHGFRKEIKEEAAAKEIHQKS